MIAVDLTYSTLNLEGSVAESWVRVKSSGGMSPPWYTSTLWHLMGLSGWWKFLRAHDFRLRPGRLPLAALITTYAVCNSILGAMQSSIYGSRLRRVPTPTDPIFVLGHWRTGTTWLHELLSQDERFTFPTTYECIAPHYCVLLGSMYQKLFAGLLPSRRAMDAMPMGFERPQEDELALVALGEPSPMWWVGYPGETAGQKYLTLRELPLDKRDRWLTTLKNFLRLVRYRRPGRAIVLKSPAHTSRLALLSAAFPAGRFVHVVRDPIAVFASTVHLWTRVHAISGLAPMETTDLYAHVLDTYVDMYREFLATVSALPSGSFHQLRYEDLVAHPLRALEECYESLWLGDFALAAPRIEKHLERARGFRTNTFEISSECREQIRARWAPIYSKWGYEV
jgi:omega-hydroxy-beta-dihydromenaquinone-9 sulfotransferase